MVEQKMFSITSICKQDIIDAFPRDKDLVNIKRKVNIMTDDDMKYLASQMADDYLEQLFWDSLRGIFNDRFME